MSVNRPNCMCDICAKDAEIERLQCAVVGKLTLENNRLRSTLKLIADLPLPDVSCDEAPLLAQRALGEKK